MSKQDTEKGKYPYLPFQTFLSLITKMEKEGIPGRIDRSYLQYTSGTNQVYLPMALRSFGLLNEDNTPTEDLTNLVKKPEERKKLLEALFRKHYAKQVALPQNATAQMLEETFAPLQGETKRKAVTFFLHAAKEAGIPLSRHFKAPRPAAGSRKPSTRRGRGSSTGTTTPETPETPETPAGSGGGMRHSIALKSGGQVTVSLSDDANIFTLSEEDETFVMGLVKALRAYGQKKSLPAGTPKQTGGEA